MNSIPVIDMRDLSSRRPVFIEGLKKAFSTYGFVGVVNADIDDQAMDRAYDVIKSFFKQPFEAKKEIKSETNCGERGYVNTESPKDKDTTSVDYKEFLHIGREPGNLWPANFKLKEPLVALFDELEKLIDPLAEAVEEAAGIEPGLVRKMLGGGDHLLRIVHYPANPPKGESWASEHTDINFLTLLPKATTEGLQAKMLDGSWCDVTVPKGALVLNVGDMMQNLTNGVFRSAVHRVVAKAENIERFSIVMFAHAHPEDRMDPLPHFGVRKYPNATRQQLLEQRIVEMGRGSRQMMEDLSASGLLQEQKALGLNCSKAVAILKQNGVICKLD